MSLPRVLFVNHTSQIAGAELVLLDVVERWTGASAFLFEDGPLNAAMTSLGIRVIGSAWGRDLSRFRRDSSIWNAIPLAGRLGAISWEIGRAARECDVVYANSQKSFVLAAVATAVCRRPLVWHLHDIIHRAHFGAMQRRIQIALANNRATQVIVPSQAAASASFGDESRCRRLRRNDDLRGTIIRQRDLDPALHCPEVGSVNNVMEVPNQGSSADCGCDSRQDEGFLRICINNIAFARGSS